MTEHSIPRATPKNALGVIALFVSIIELAFAYPVTVLSGNAQLAFLSFMIAFPLLVACPILLRYRLSGLTLRCRGRCAIKPRSAPDLER